jgi:hypothetical protein
VIQAVIVRSAQLPSWPNNDQTNRSSRLNGFLTSTALWKNWLNNYNIWKKTWGCFLLTRFLTSWLISYPPTKSTLPFPRFFSKFLWLNLKVVWGRNNMKMIIQKLLTFYIKYLMIFTLVYLFYVKYHMFDLKVHFV